jgi:hypothetical protein
MNIRKKFLQLTSKTYPHGTEDQLKKQLPKGYKEDGFGNFYIEVGSNSSTMFTCHLDTADRQQKVVRHIIDGDIIKTDGSSILGADDKAGMTVMLNMIEKEVPGLYYFFIGEERGCVGSSRLSRNWKSSEFSNRITKCISFDRRGTDSVITEQLYGVCCSIGFAKELSNRLNSTKYDLKYSPDPTGIYTDSAQFTTLIPECTNISVGYYNEHTHSEKQDIKHLEKLSRAVCEIDWETLPILRNDLTEYNFEYVEDEWNVSDDEGFQTHNFTWVNHNGKTSKMMISNTQIEKEKNTIHTWLKSNGNDYFVDLEWDGQNLHGASYSGQYELVATRDELMDYISELSEIPINHLKSFV